MIAAVTTEPGHDVAAHIGRPWVLLVEDEAELAGTLPVGAARLALDAREVVAGSTRTALSQRECDLLAALAARPRQVFGRDGLLAPAFQEAENPVVVDTCVHDLRRKLGRGVVETVRGRGYRLGTPLPEADDPDGSSTDGAGATADRPLG